MPKIEVTAEVREYDGYLKIDKAIVQETSESGDVITYNRFKLTRPDAVAIVIYNYDEDAVVLIKQHRYPTHGLVDGDIYEIVAGKIDDGEEPRISACREIREEVGYDIKPENLIFRGEYFASPGYSTEKFYIFLASVQNSDKISDGGGLEGEHENIEIFHVPAPEFFKMVADGQIIDAKTALGANALWHVRNKEIVKAGFDHFEAMRLKNSIELANQVIDETNGDEESK